MGDGPQYLEGFLRCKGLFVGERGEEVLVGSLTGGEGPTTVVGGAGPGGVPENSSLVTTRRGTLG